VRRCEKSSDRTGSTRVGAVDGHPGLSERRGLRVIGMSASALRYQPRSGSQRSAAGEDHCPGAATPSLRRRNDLPQAAAGRRARQPQTRRAALWTGEAASAAPAAQEDSCKRATTADPSWGGERGVVGGLRIRSHRLRTHAQVSCDRRRRQPRGDRGDRRALYRRRAPDTGARWHLLTTGTACSDPHRQRTGVLRESDAHLGPSQRGDASADRTRQAEPECLRRIVQTGVYATSA